MSSTGIDVASRAKNWEPTTFLKMWPTIGSNRSILLPAVAASVFEAEL
jgi:hypothetical protein